MIFQTDNRIDESDKHQRKALIETIFLISRAGAFTMLTQVTQLFFLERVNTPTGRMLIVTDDLHRMRAADWEDHEQRMRTLLRQQYGANAIELLETSRPSAARRSLDAYFEGDISIIDSLPVATQGTEFQRKVWEALRRIPVGHPISYSTLAAQIGRPTATRAVGHANGSNPISIVVPCHRVIGANASLTGYGGGLDRKRWLLAHESAYSMPRSESN